MNRLASSLAAVVLLMAACTIPPVAFHDGLPAATIAPGDAAARIQYNRGWWFRDGKTEPMQYFSGGLRFGQDWGRFCFEEGLTVLNPGGVLPCLHGGIGNVMVTEGPVERIEEEVHHTMLLLGRDGGYFPAIDHHMPTPDAHCAAVTRAIERWGQYPLR